MEQINFSNLPNGEVVLKTTQSLHAPLPQVFEFFANALNLQLITPPWLDFRVIDEKPTDMYAGKLIDYRLKLHGIPIRWRSEISRWDPPRLFVDEQRRGPYRRWHHEHRFTESDGCVLVEDIVHYRVLGGALIERLFVRPDLRKIFTYRHQRLVEIFAARSV